MVMTGDWFMIVIPTRQAMQVCKEALDRVRPRSDQKREVGTPGGLGEWTKNIQKLKKKGEYGQYG